MNIPSHVIVRADGSATLGLGNITRSLAIAEVFQERGATVVFAARDLDPRVRDMVEAMHCRFAPLPAVMTVEQDVAETRALAKTHDTRHCIVDLGNPEATHDVAAYSGYLHRLATSLNLIIADDLTRAVFPKSVVVNPNTEVTHDDYDTQLGPELLFGPRYAILRSFYRDAARGKLHRDGGPQRVLVCLGGGAVAGSLLDSVVRAIRNAFDAQLHLEVVTGLGDGARLRESGVLDGFAAVSIHASLPAMRDVLTAADVAFVSGGVLKYEAAATGTPMVIVPSIDHQESWGSSFARTGAAIYGGHVHEINADRLAELSAPLGDPTTRRNMGDRAAALVDGYGAVRIVDTALTLAEQPEWQNR
jgi:spore coat polysaccharide biosynthesis predicted glycosyltransferase SpsG